jgi:hypothetical protein
VGEEVDVGEGGSASANAVASTQLIHALAGTGLQLHNGRGREAPNIIIIGADFRLWDASQRLAALLAISAGCVSCNGKTGSLGGHRHRRQQHNESEDLRHLYGTVK